MNIWKYRILHIIYFYERIISIIILCVGGIVALGVVYQFLFTTPVVEFVQDATSEVALNQEAVSRLTLWSQKRKDESVVPFSISESAFDILDETP